MLSELGCASPLVGVLAGATYLAMDNDVMAEMSIPLGSGIFLASIFGPSLAFACSAHHSKMKMLQLKAVIEQKCLVQNCKITKVEYKTSHKKKPVTSYKVLYPNGNWFQISTDYTAVEVQMKPMTTAEVKEFKPILQRDLFDSAKEIHLKVSKHDLFSGGHISLGFTEKFKDNPLLFRNFLVDQMNHSELQNGILVKDPINAVSAHRYKKVFGYIDEVIYDFDQGKIKTSEELAEKLVGVLKNRMFIDLQTITRKDFPQDQKRIEVRAHRSQKNAEEFYKLIKLYDGRIAYLEKLKAPINLSPIPVHTAPESQVRNFERYVVESGEDFQDYLQMLPEKYQDTYKQVGHTAAKCTVSVIKSLTDTDVD
jgi:hypothetical protein